MGTNPCFSEVRIMAKPNGLSRLLLATRAGIATKLGVELNPGILATRAGIATKLGVELNPGIVEAIDPEVAIKTNHTRLV